MKLYIKYMASDRCKLAVKEELRKLGLNFSIVGLGEVEIMEDISVEMREKLKVALLNLRFELVDDSRGILNEKIKNAIIEMIYCSDQFLKIKNSDYISKKLNYDYTYLSNIFSQMNGYPIQQFILANKIEKVKGLLCNGELNLTEISYKLNYSSVAHLSYQFKKVTGLTPSLFKKLNYGNGISIKDYKNSTVASFGLVG
jgi:AraC-like DNA-binding protein